MPIETLCSGLYGTQATVELAVRKNARYLFSSTSEVYGDPEVTPQPETYCGRVSPIGKRSQYDESKRGAETLLSLYYKKYGLDIRVARLFNTYGPGMDLADGRVVTNFIQAVLDQKPMIVHGDGSQTRSFAHVSDTVQGLYSLLMTDLFTDNSSFNDRIVNIGNDGEFTVNELAQKVNELAQKNSCRGVPVVHVDPIDMTDPKKRRPDLTKARFLLHYNPYTGLDEGLEKTLSYFEARRKGK